MFTGIIEEKGVLRSRTPLDGAETLVFSADLILSDLKPGHSIAVNGVCLTVIELTETGFSVQVIPQTLAITSVGDLKIGQGANLERAMLASDRFHGHMVQGHVETVGRVRELTQVGDDVRLTVELEPAWLKYCIPKGSITLDGVSLTIAELHDDAVMVALIPLTLELTSLGEKARGAKVNIETDMIARQLERLIQFSSNSGENTMKAGLLERWGYTTTK